MSLKMSRGTPPGENFFLLFTFACWEWRESMVPEEKVLASGPDPAHDCLQWAA